MTRHHLNILALILNCSCIALFFSGTAWMWILMGCASLLFLFFLSLGILLPNRNYFIRTTTHLKSQNVLLTFDDGPDPILTPKVLDILASQNVHALFFVIGDKAKSHPEIIQRILKEGHALGNHTQTHPLMFAALNQDKVDREIGLCDNTLIAQGVHPGHFFRPPVGYTNPRIARASKKFNKHVIGWNIRSFDSVFKEETKLLDRLMKRIRPGAIVLLHDNLEHSVNVLNRFISESKKNGIKFANPQELKAIKK